MKFFFKSVDFDSMTVFFFNTDIEKQLRKKKYYEITKSEVYQKKFVFELKKFIRNCQNVFRIRFVIYEQHKAKIKFAVFFLFNQISKFNWIWIRYRINLNVVLKFSFIWIEFFVFLKKHVNFVKLRIANIEKKFHFLKQRFEQTIFQLIIYLKTLK